MRFALAILLASGSLLIPHSSNPPSAAAPTVRAGTLHFAVGPVYDNQALSWPSERLNALNGLSAAAQKASLDAAFAQLDTWFTAVEKTETVGPAGPPSASAVLLAAQAWVTSITRAGEGPFNVTPSVDRRSWRKTKRHQRFTYVLHEGFGPETEGAEGDAAAGASDDEEPPVPTTVAPSRYVVYVTYDED